MPKGRPRKLDYEEAVQKAIKDVEIEDFPNSAKVPRVLKKLSERECKITRRTLYNVLDRLISKGSIEKVGRGLYSRKIAILLKKMHQESLISEVFETVPRLESEAFNAFISKQLPTFNKLEQEYQKKRYNPFRRWQYKKKLRDLQERKERIEHSYIRPLIRDRLKFIEKATEVTVLSSKNFDYLNIYKIREILAEVLYQWFLHEIDIAESVGQRSSLENLSLNIIISFEPRRADAIPTGSTSEWEKTVTSRLHEIKRFPLIAKEMGFDKEKERLERYLQIIQRQKELDRVEWERSKSA